MEKLILEQLGKINDKLNGISRELGENSAQHDAMDQRLDEIHEQTTKTNGRVTVLESKWAKVTGVAIGASAIFSFVVNMVL